MRAATPTRPHLQTCTNLLVRAQVHVRVHVHVRVRVHDPSQQTGRSQALGSQRLTLSLVCRPWHAYLSGNQRCIVLGASKGTQRGLSLRPEATLVLYADPGSRLEDLLEALSIHTSLRSVHWIMKDTEPGASQWRRSLDTSLITSMSSLQHLVSLNLPLSRDIQGFSVRELEVSLPHLRALSHGIHIPPRSSIERPSLNLPVLVTLELSLFTYYGDYGDVDPSSRRRDAHFSLPSLRHLYCTLQRTVQNYQFFLDLLKDTGRHLETLGLDASPSRKDNHKNLNKLLSNVDTSIWPLCPSLQTLAGPFQWLDFGNPGSERDGGALTSLYHTGPITWSLHTSRTIKWLREESAQGRRKVEIRLVSAIGPDPDQVMRAQVVKILQRDGIEVVDGRGSSLDTSVHT